MAATSQPRAGGGQLGNYYCRSWDGVTITAEERRSKGAHYDYEHFTSTSTSTSVITSTHPPGGDSPIETDSELAYRRQPHPSFTSQATRTYILLLPPMLPPAMLSSQVGRDRAAAAEPGRLLPQQAWRGPYCNGIRSAWRAEASSSSNSSSCLDAEEEQ